MVVMVARYDCMSHYLTVHLKWEVLGHLSLSTIKNWKIKEEIFSQQALYGHIFKLDQ
jgi:hypothetical protein